ncbi:hypothetical protein LCGC14_1542750 [marine sediment metagenome]|uniref:Uncharacterized protein n=1 Tax=marine sediment metagenome TaxID=412755 RepID=A0A0F9JDJ7_9ZZZZ
MNDYTYDPELAELEGQLEAAEREAKKERIRRRLRELGEGQYKGRLWPPMNS